MNITTKTIRETKPVFDPVTGKNSQGVTISNGILTEDYSASVIDFLNHRHVPTLYKLSVVLSGEFLDEKTLRLFAVWCVERGLKKIANPDKRVLKACKVSRKYAKGKATQKQAKKAMYAAVDAKRESLISGEGRYLIYTCAYSLCDPVSIDAAHICDGVARAVSDTSMKSWEMMAVIECERVEQLKKLISMVS